MKFEEIVQKRYATKVFDGKKIPKTKINKLLEMIRMSASSYNMQPWVIKVVEAKETKEKLSPAAWNQPQIKSCSHLFIMCANTDLAGRIKEMKEEMIKSGADENKIAPYIKMISEFERKMTDEDKLDWAQKQVYLALGNALNGAKSLGFDSCPIEGFDPLQYTKILGLPQNLVPTVLCAVGFAADKPRPKFRLPKEKIFELSATS